MSTSLDTIVSLCKRRGFAYPTSEIYGGLTSSYDYGPLGTAMLRRIKNAWWKECIENRIDMVGIDSQIFLNPQTWVASGHVGSFNDPLVEDKVTHDRFRADHLIENWLKDHPEVTGVIVEDMDLDAMTEFINTHQLKSPKGNDITPPKAFSLLFETAIGTVVGEKTPIYLRGETAQGIFTNFKNILDSTRVKLPFGVGQIGKAFRNEITSGQFVFRTLEFEQAEIEYFFDPNKQSWQELMDQWKGVMWNFVTKTLGIKEENLRWRQHTDKERSHYSTDTYDLEYKFPFGYKELWGIAYRTDFDLKAHSAHSGQPLEYTDPQTNEKITPHVIEPALGINRTFLMALADAYTHDEAANRTVLKLHPNLAPYQVAVFPLLKNKPELVEKANSILQLLSSTFTCVWDDRGNIGKRYFSQDEIGTPLCITIDFNTLESDQVTVRKRDTAVQETVAIANLIDYIQLQLK
jgi:glycyl-tRNA synthetase